ncbi:alpha/beta fold hydrolase [Donghicola sp. B5-SW-15]|uniref:Alpha/beta fold hydrolase n=2 Tax=Donghicola mangrovi TaxID=2729614 RepID=A0A850QAH9_9RHOB|nr:alpha/beta fold hydrolase [Donghicola mangrovi]
MNTPAVTERHRLIAFDMPWHGKSLPPEGFQTQEYLLQTDAYIKTVLAVIEGLGLEKPILAGCSMGGRIALQLAALHADQFGAYDLTCTPEDAKRTADQIPGATLAVMDELGHFPMSEHPEGFLPFFVDALAKMGMGAECLELQD